MKLLQSKAKRKKSVCNSGKRALPLGRIAECHDIRLLGYHGDGARFTRIGKIGAPLFV